MTRKILFIRFHEIFLRFETFKSWQFVFSRQNDIASEFEFSRQKADFYNTPKEIWIWIFAPKILIWIMMQKKLNLQNLNFYAKKKENMKIVFVAIFSMIFFLWFISYFSNKYYFRDFFFQFFFSGFFSPIFFFFWDFFSKIIFFFRNLFFYHFFFFSINLSLQNFFSTFFFENLTCTQKRSKVKMEKIEFSSQIMNCARVLKQCICAWYMRVLRRCSALLSKLDPGPYQL